MVVLLPFPSLPSVSKQFFRHVLGRFHDNVSAANYLSLPLACSDREVMRTLRMMDGHVTGENF